MKKTIHLMFLLIVSSISYAQTTNIPDTIFEHYLETHSKIDGSVVAVGDANSMGNGIDDDHLVTTANISNITFLDVSDLGISDMTGIEDFTGVETFICSNNSLTTLDASNNHFLEFACDNNQLTSLILNADARVVDCSNNQLTSINTPASLANLDCSNNQFTVLDLSDVNQELSVLNCSNNQLTSLDLRNGINTQIVNNYDFDTRNNPNLTCIFVDDSTYSINTWTNIDATSHFVADEAACTALATEEFALNEFKILSNPVFDTIKISIQEVAEYRLINMNGKILQKGRLTIGYNTINATKLAKGIYFLNISSLNKNITKKIIK